MRKDELEQREHCRIAKRRREADTPEKLIAYYVEELGFDPLIAESLFPTA